MLLSLEHGLWAPNLHFHNPNPKIPALQDGRLQVVDRPCPSLGARGHQLPFGFGGLTQHQPSSSPTPSHRHLLAHMLPCPVCCWPVGAPWRVCKVCWS